MTGPRSLRWRFILGGGLWTFGLLMVAHLASQLVLPRLFWLMGAHRPSLVFVAVVMMGVGFVWVRSGWAPVRQLHARLLALQRGETRQLEGQYPSELQPLVDDLNALLVHREKMVERAQAKAADLAHGLKTPLAILAQEAERAAAAGHLDLANTLQQQVERMHCQVQYHLAHARASGGAPGARTPVQSCAEALVRALARLYQERDLRLELAIEPTAVFRGVREDLDEILGNLLDNACRWSNTRVVLRCQRQAESLEVLVDDDGPGLPPALREEVMERGVRVDQQPPDPELATSSFLEGAGLGLAIVRDLVELYGGQVRLEESPLGGLRVRLSLPSS